MPDRCLVGDGAAAAVGRAVESGATLLMSFFSGIVDPAEHIRLGGYPQPFRALLGLDVVDFHPLSAGEDVALQFADGAQGRGEIWSEDIRLNGAEVLATFSGSHLDGRPAITRHRAGNGTAIYLATRPDPKTMARLLEMACASASVEASADAPSGVEAVRRTAGGKSFLFLLNHREVAVDVPISTAGVNLVDGSSVHPGLVHLGSRGVAVIREGW